MENNDLLEFKNFFQQGLVSDLHWTQVHYFIYRCIGENYKGISKKDEDVEKDRLVYLQHTSSELAILHLSKIYDRQNNKYKVRSLENVITDSKKIQSTCFPVSVENYPSIQKLSTLSEIPITNDILQNQSTFASYLKLVLQANKTRAAIKNLLLVRDKFLAHNEHNTGIEGVPSFWDDFAYLMNIAKLLLNIIADLFLRTSYSMDEEVTTNKIDLYVYNSAGWIISTLEDYLGDEYICWYKI